MWGRASQCCASSSPGRANDFVLPLVQAEHVIVGFLPNRQSKSVCASSSPGRYGDHAGVFQRALDRALRAGAFLFFVPGTIVPPEVVPGTVVLFEAVTNAVIPPEGRVAGC